MIKFNKYTFFCLVSGINNLETVGFSFIDSISIIENLKLCMRKIPDRNSKDLKVTEKFENILQKNLGFSAMYNSTCTWRKKDYQNLHPQFDKDDVKFFKYVPITSYDGERSFSQYKNILSKRWRSFTFNNLKKFVICYFYKQNKSAKRRK